MLLKELLHRTDGIVYGDLNPDILSITQDSRAVVNGSLFVAIKGYQQDGHDYIDSAISQGAKAVIVEVLPMDYEERIKEGTTFVLTSDVRTILSQIARGFYHAPDKKVDIVGITGTNGKTSLTYILEAILNAEGKNCGVIGTISVRYLDYVETAKGTTPESLELMKHFYQMNERGVHHAVMEVSSHALALKRVEGITFKVGIFTNLTQDHLDFHETMEGYFTAKKQLFEQVSGLSLINIDDEYGLMLYQDLKKANKNVQSYGFSHHSDVRIDAFTMDFSGCQFDLITSEGKKHFQIGMPGRFNVYNFTAAIAAARYLDISETVIEKTIGITRVPGRIEPVEHDLHIPLYVDYAHTPDALDKVIKTIKEFTPGRVICVFGCGGERDRGKRPLMGAIAESLAEVAIVTSDNPRTEDPACIIKEILMGMKHPDRCKVEADRQSAIRLALEMATENDSILIAGKGHEDYQIIGTEKVYFDDRFVAQEMARLIYDQRKR